MTRPYRDVEEREPPSSREPLVVAVGDRQENWVAKSMVRLFVTFFAAVIFHVLQTTVALLASLAVGLLWTAHGVRGRRGARARIRIDRGRLVVDRGEGAPTSIDLDALDDVRLDTKVPLGDPTVPRADVVHSIYRAGSPTVVAVDRSRIELVVRGGKVVPLGEEYARATDCAESFRALRRFLRAHQWTPLDERDAPLRDEHVGVDRRPGATALRVATNPIDPADDVDERDHERTET